MIEGAICQICGSDKDVNSYCGGALAFMCKNCDKITRRWDYARAVFSQTWSGATDGDIKEMEGFAKHNQNLRKPANVDTSMDIFDKGE